MTGGFFLTLDPTTIQIYETASLSFGVGDAQVVLGQTTGLVIVKTGLDGQIPGVAGMLSTGQSRDLGLPGIGNLFKASGSTTIMFNTTLRDQVFQIPDSFLPLLNPGDPTSITIFASAPGLDGKRRANAPPGGEIYIVATIQANIAIGGVLTLDGFIQIEAAIDPATGFRLKITGAVGTQIPFLGSLAGTLNFTVFIGDAEHTGIVGRVFLTLNSNSIPGVQLNGVFMLELNTFSTTKSVETFQINKDGNGHFTGFAHDAAGHLVVATQTLDVVGGFKLLMAGELIVADTLHISAEVQFRIEAGGADPGIELIVNGTMHLDPIGGIDLVDSGFRINRDGLVARVQIGIKADFGSAIGLKFSVGGLIALNTTGRVQTLGSSSVDPGFRLRIEGEVSFIGFAKGSGFVDITISSAGFQLLFGVSFNLGGLIFHADGGAAVVSDGFALKLNIRAIADALVFSIDASGTLQINTSASTRLGIAPKSFLLDLRGKLELLKVLKLDAGLRVEVNGDGWSLHADASLDFFGIATLSGSVDLDSEGGFDVQLRGHMVIGSSSFGLIGDFHFRVRSQVLERTPFGNTYIFELSGGASVEARVFGITLAGVGLDFAFTAQGAGRTKIELSVTVRIHLLFVTVKKTAHFTVGYLELPPLVYLAASPGSGATSAHTWSPPPAGQQLALNVGDRGQFRGIGTDGTVAGTDPDESYVVEQLDGDATKATIKVSAFGRSNTFTGVTAILGNFGTGDDNVRIADNVKIPVTLNMGTGDDVVIYGGSGNATINGNAGQRLRRGAFGRRHDDDGQRRRGRRLPRQQRRRHDDRPRRRRERPPIGGSASDQLYGDDRRRPHQRPGGDDRRRRRRRPCRALLRSVDADDHGRHGQRGPPRAPPPGSWPTRAAPRAVTASGQWRGCCRRPCGRRRCSSRARVAR